MAAITKVSVFHAGEGYWHYVALSSEGHDHRGLCRGAGNAKEAIAWASAKWPDAEVAADQSAAPKVFMVYRKFEGRNKEFIGAYRSLKGAIKNCEDLSREKLNTVIDERGFSLFPADPRKALTMHPPGETQPVSVRYWIEVFDLED